MIWTRPTKPKSVAGQRGFTSRFVDVIWAANHSRALLFFAQFAALKGLPGLVTRWNAPAGIINISPAAPSPVQPWPNANKIRSVYVFANTFSQTSGLMDCTACHDSHEMLRLIDSTPHLDKVERLYSRPEKARR